MLAPLFAWLGRYAWRRAFTWRKPSAAQMLWVFLMRVGDVPLIITVTAFLFTAWRMDYDRLLYRNLPGGINWRGDSLFPGMLLQAVSDGTVFGAQT